MFEVGYSFYGCRELMLRGEVLGGGGVICFVALCFRDFFWMLLECVFSVCNFRCY